MSKDDFATRARLNAEYRILFIKYQDTTALLNQDRAEVRANRSNMSPEAFDATIRALDTRLEPIMTRIEDISLAIAETYDTNTTEGNN